MEYTKDYFPASFKILNKTLFEKAIEIGNNLLKAGYQENLAESIAFSNAKIWPLPNQKQLKNGRTKSNLHLVPHPDGWALISQDASTIYLAKISKSEVHFKARIMAKNEKLRLYIHAPGGHINDSESFVVNLPVLGSMSSSLVTQREDSIDYLNSTSPLILSGGKAVKKAKMLAKKMASKLTGKKEQSKGFSIDI